MGVGSSARESCVRCRGVRGLLLGDCGGDGGAREMDGGDLGLCVMLMRTGGGRSLAIQLSRRSADARRALRVPAEAEKGGEASRPHPCAAARAARSWSAIRTAAERGMPVRHASKGTEAFTSGAAGVGGFDGGFDGSFSFRGITPGLTDEEGAGSASSGDSGSLPGGEALEGVDGSGVETRFATCRAIPSATFRLGA